MIIRTLKTLRWVVVLVALLAVAVAPVPQGQTAAADAPNSPEQAPAAQVDKPNGLVCTSRPDNTFTLNTREGYIKIPDGNIVYMWGFSEGSSGFQHPSPTLCVHEGDTVTVILNNALDEAVSIIFPGQENVLANGQPAAPQFDGTGALVSLTNVAAPNGSVTYSFVATNPGTYIYESGTEPAKQVQMGLFGTLVVRPALGDNFAYNRPDAQFNPETEYLIMLSEIDPLMHQAVEWGQPFDMNQYLPRYFMINGRSFPDTVAPNGATWVPNQPYGSLAHIHPYDAVANPDPMLVRYVNVGSHEYSFHPHGNHGRLIGQDGSALEGPTQEDLSYEKFTVTTAPGQTMEATFAWHDVEGWNPVDNPIPIVIPQLQNLTYGTYFSGSPYLGYADKLPVGTTPLNQCSEYYHIAHNHALHEATAWGVVMSGHITFTRIDPPLPNDCQ